MEKVIERVRNEGERERERVRSQRMNKREIIGNRDMESYEREEEKSEREC